MDLDPKKAPAKRQVNFFSALSIVGEFGLIIALPLLFFVYVGKYLDSHFNSKYFSILGIAIALFTSTTLIYRQIKKIIKDIKS